jgi:hypothetical protein
MKNIIQENIQTQELWVVKGTITIILVFFLSKLYIYIYIYITIPHCACIVKKSHFFFMLGIVLYHIIIVSSLVPHLTCYVYLVFAPLGLMFQH